MTTEGCSATICPSEEELRPIRAIAFSGWTPVLLIIWFNFSWRPVVPEVEFVIARLVQGMVFLVSWGLCFKDVQGDGAESARECSHFITRLIEPFVWLGNKIQATYDWWQQNMGGQYLKIYITYLQILSSFNIYPVQWPATFLACINWVRGTVKFEFLKLPNLSCLWYGVSWKTTVFTYTLTPVVMIVVFGIPVLAALCRRLHLTAITRWNDTFDRFCRNLTFSFFLMYPMLAMATMSSLNCEPNVGRLRDDLRIICPELQSFESIYSDVFIVLYAIGIPVFNHLCLRYMGIVKTVKEKIQRAEFHAMLSLFMKIYVSIETQRFARLVGNVDGNSKEFKRQCKHQYDMLIKLQSGGSAGIDDDDDIDLKKLEKVAEEAVGTSQGMQGTSLKDIITCLKEFDEDGNGNISEKEFQKMLITARKKGNLYTGTEDDPNTLNLEQLQALILKLQGFSGGLPAARSYTRPSRLTSRPRA
jgi:Fe-S-cluster formation regulator IscX/YfhJ